MYGIFCAESQTLFQVSSPDMGSEFLRLGVQQSSEGHDLVKRFISSIVAFFQDCFREAERENNDKQKAIKVEKVFAERRADGSQYIAAVQNVWDNLLCCLEQIPEDTNNEFSKAATTILQQILLHFWSAKIDKAQFNVKSDDQQTKIKSFSTICMDSSEHESIKDHAGWALKRARDVLINGPNQIPLKETDEPTSTILYPNKSSVLEIISHLGTDVKQSDSKFRFLVHVTPFFIYLHNLLQEMLKPANFESQRGNVLLRCLSQVSKNKELRGKWLALISDSDLKTTIVVLQRVVTFFEVETANCERKRIKTK